MTDQKQKGGGRRSLWPDEPTKKFFYKGPESLERKIDETVKALKDKNLKNVSKSSVQRILIENNLVHAEELFRRENGL